MLGSQSVNSLLCISVFLTDFEQRPSASICLYLLSPELVVGAMSYVCVFDCDILWVGCGFYAWKTLVCMCACACKGEKRETRLSRHLSCASLA